MDKCTGAELDDIAAYCAYKFKLTSMSKSQKPTVTVKDKRDQLLQQHPGAVSITENGAAPPAPPQEPENDTGTGPPGQ